MVFDDNIINWLSENNNPAIEYRTKKELLEEKADNSKVIDWVKKILPADWKHAKGLWLTYHYTTIAESGLDGSEFDIKEKDIIDCYKNKPFEYGCDDFMLLRALIKLGYEEVLQKIGIMEALDKKLLSDGGFLCINFLKKKGNMSKSCVKCNNMALLFLSECKKKNIKTSIEDRILQYFWDHNLFYKSNDLSSLILETREGWRTIDTFFPFEVMRVGIQNIVEAFSVLGYGNDSRLKAAWKLLEAKADKEGKYILDGTLSKPYLPKEKTGKPSKWVTFYALMGKKYLI